VVQRDKLLEQLKLVDDGAYGLFLFATIQGEKDKYQARFFSPGMNGEDPATGSAAGPLSALLYDNNLLHVGNGVGRIRVLQGLQVGRECEISVALHVQQDDGKVRLDVDLEGTGVEVAKGDMRIPSVDIRF
jgi:PhzF family phenazine biosynthesis protein